MNGLDLDLQNSSLLKIETDKKDQEKARKIIAGKFWEEKDQAVTYMSMLGLL